MLSSSLSNHPSPLSSLDAARDLGNFHMIDDDNSDSYMAKATALNGADLDRLMVLGLLLST